MNRRAEIVTSLAALLAASSLTACGASSSADAEVRQPATTSGNIHEHEAHRSVEEGTAGSTSSGSNIREHLAHQSD